IPVGQVRFRLEIAPRMQEMAARPVGHDARRFRRAFISYASADRDEVLRRTQMLAAVGIGYFADVLRLEPGERWERILFEQIDDCDLFLLFWSHAAKASEWVRREVDYALERKAGDDERPPEIRPVILEGPAVIEPWEELAHLHFADPLTGLIHSEPNAPDVPQ
ncbi:MAG: toll/interleukin-1 receptor domain-containing protein, partial [Chloroflexota bacterium]